MALLDSTQSLILVDALGVPAAGDFLETTEPVILNPTVSSGEYQRTTGKKNSKSTYIDTNHSTVSFSIPGFLRGNDTTGAALDTVPKISSLFKMCGLSETVVATVGSESVTYEPTQDAITGGYVTSYTDGYKRELTGALGNLSIEFTVGEPVKFSAEMMAYVSALAPTAAANPSVTLDTNELLICNKVSVVTIAGSTFNAKSGTLNMNHTIEDIYAVGLGSYESADFAPTIELNGFKTAGDESAWTDLTSRAAKQIIVQFGSVNGKAAKIVVDAAVVSAVEESADQNKIASKVTYNCERSEAVTEGFKIVYGTM